MRMMQLVFAATAAIVVASAAAAEAQTVLKLGFATSATSPYGYAAEIFAQEVKEKSGGRLEIEIFPASQLGGEREMIESLQIGTLDLNFTSPAPLGNFVPEVAIFEVPFLIRGFQHADAVLDGEFGASLIENINNHNLVGLGFGYLGPVHMVTNPRGITKPDDLSGLKIRTQENEIHLITFRTLGALPTPMAFPELFGALQQGAVDGMDNPSTTVLSGRFYQAAKYLSLTGHRFIITPILASPATWAQLSEEDRGIVADASMVAARALRARVQELEADTIKQLAAEGMEVVDGVDSEAFVEALAPAYEEFARRFGQDALDAVRTAN
jgi:TRAP-type transport system periplasmic protein